MNTQNAKELEKWNEAKSHTDGVQPVELGPYFSYIIRKTPRRLLHLLSYYKFAAKMIGPSKRILEVGCSEALGSVILSEFATDFLGVDIDQPAIESAKQNFGDEKRKFLTADILKTKQGMFDAVVNFDVIEHIFPENEDTFLKALTDHVNPEGMILIGTPNINSDVYASPMTKAGHVNLYSADRLQKSLERYFKKVVVFSANDEMVHTGFHPLAHYLIAIGFFKRN